jgi:hypothetical protein
MDPLHLAIALGPLATYLLVLGVINLQTRPLVTSGSRDAAALAVALSGLVVAGPMELFLVEEAAVLYGAGVWAMMLAAYWLVASLAILLMRPRLVIYNIAIEQLRPVLAQVAAQLDSEARWVGDSIVLPQLHVQLGIENFPMLQNVQLVSIGSQQSLAGWQRLEAALAGALRKSRSPRNAFGVVAASLSVLLATVITVALASDPAGAVQALGEMLRR